MDTARAITVVGKHLCGGATDMGIRCAVNTLNRRQQKYESSEVSQSSIDHDKNLSDHQKTLPESSEASQSDTGHEKHLSDQNKALSESSEASQSFKNGKARDTDFSNCIEPFTEISPHSDAPIASQIVPPQPKPGSLATEADPAQVKNTDKNKNTVRSRVDTCGEPPVKILKIGDRLGESERQVFSCCFFLNSVILKHGSIKNYNMLVAE